MQAPALGLRRCQAMVQVRYCCLLPATVCGQSCSSDGQYHIGTESRQAGATVHDVGEMSRNGWQYDTIHCITASPAAQHWLRTTWHSSTWLPC